ncbi:hypothetical protein IJ182_09445 [bacterium]|nr:hypothetical protein [bacterium]
MGIFSKRLMYSNAEESEANWSAWTNGNNTVYTQTDEPEIICDWTFSSPNNIANKITAVGNNTITSNGITYTRDKNSDRNDKITAFFFSIQTDIHTANNKTFEIPIKNTTYINALNVDWGDGTQETINNIAYPSHTYAQTGTYQIKISAESGCMPYFYYKTNISQQVISVDSALLTFYNGTTKLTSWGSTYGFGVSFTNLEYIPTSILFLNRDATALPRTFDSSKLLKLPKNMFKYNKKITNLQSTFYATKITEIPEGFFDGLESLTQTSACFESSTLTTIPYKLFKNNKKISIINSLFRRCSNLTLTPAEVLNRLFDGTDYTNYGKITMDSLLGSVPTTTKTNLTEAYLDKFKEIRGSFYSCCDEWILDEIPSGIFDKYTTETIFSRCFQNCASLKTVPERLFEKNVAAIDFQRCFSGCSFLLMNSNIFCNEATDITTRFANVSPDFSYCFYYTGTSTKRTGTGTAPQLWNYTFAYADTLVESTNTISDFNKTSRTLTTDEGEVFTYNSSLKLASSSTIYKWISNSDSSKMLYTTVSYSSVSLTAKLYNIENIMGGGVKSNACFGANSNSIPKISNYSSIPSSWR